MLVLNNVSSGYSTDVINSNFVAIANYINQNLLNRNGLIQGEANQMENSLDMNGQDIINLAGVASLLNKINQLEQRIRQLEGRQ